MLPIKLDITGVPKPRMTKSDARSVRNSVLGAILTAMIIWISGTAFSTLYRSPVPTNHTTAK